MILPNQKGDPSAETRTKTIIFPIAKETVVVFTFGILVGIAFLKINICQFMGIPHEE